MKTKYQIDDKQVADMDLTISMTMRVRDWRDLMNVMPRKWPGWDVESAIREALGQIEKATSQTFGDSN